MFCFIKQQVYILLFFLVPVKVISRFLEISVVVLVATLYKRFRMLPVITDERCCFDKGLKECENNLVY